MYDRGVNPYRVWQVTSLTCQCDRGGGAEAALAASSRAAAAATGEGGGGGDRVTLGWQGVLYHTSHSPHVCRMLQELSEKDQR